MIKKAKRTYLQVFAIDYPILSAGKYQVIDFMQTSEKRTKYLQ